MEFVPYEYCASICALLKNLVDLELLCRAKSSCDFWNAAIEKDLENRPKYALTMSYSQRGNLLYHIENFPRLTIEKLQSTHFRLEKISFSSRSCQHLTDLKTFCQFVSPCIYKTDLDILEDSGNFPGRWLDVCKDRLFRNVNMHYMKTKGKVTMSINDLQNAKLKSAGSNLPRITNFALQGNFNKLKCANFSFDFQFFHQLFLKRVNGMKECSFSARFAFNIGDLHKFQKDRLVNAKQFIWSREDGVVVTLQKVPRSRKRNKNLYLVQFSSQ